jgi:hypothetical protein
MEHLLLFENYNFRTMILRHDHFGEISVDLEGSRIKEVVNNSRINFPFHVGSNWNRSIYTWACNNKFGVIETIMNGRMVKKEDTCPEKKIFGVKTKDVPQGHEWRTIFPNKFK